MNNDLISREALKKAIINAHINMELTFDISTFNCVMNIIDNAPTVDIKDELAGAYNEGFMCGNKEAEKARPQGEWIRKEDVIHHIAKQYSAHNELVPIWLSIGDLKGGDKNV